jgi:hypothetical protein
VLQIAPHAQIQALDSVIHAFLQVPITMVSTYN